MSTHPLVALRQTLQEAEQFAAGFEHDEAQQPVVTTLLANLRAQITVVNTAIEAEHVRRTTALTNAQLAIAQAKHDRVAGGAA